MLSKEDIAATTSLHYLRLLEVRVVRLQLVLIGMNGHFGWRDATDPAPKAHD